MIFIASLSTEFVEYVILKYYHLGMKIAISIPDDIFEDAEYLSRQQGKSRSKLYADAVAEYVGVYRIELITEQLNTVYGAESSTLNAALESAQYQILEEEDW